MTGDRPAQTLVFGFGSLAAELARRPERRASPDGYVADLVGFRRTWNVAMDNSVTVPGYKYYLDPATGERPAVSVTFVNLREAPGERVNGYCFPATAEQLAALDARERNYSRVDVSDLIEPNPGLTVVAYLGTDEARERFARAAAGGSAVVSAGYRRSLGDGFGRLGHAEKRRFEASTDEPGCPVRELRRIDLPG